MNILHMISCLILLTMAVAVSSMCMTTTNGELFVDGQYVGPGSHTLTTINQNGQVLYKVNTITPGGQARTQYLRPDPESCRKMSVDTWNQVMQSMPPWISSMFQKRV